VGEREGGRHPEITNSETEVVEGAPVETQARGGARAAAAVAAAVAAAEAAAAFAAAAMAFLRALRVPPVSTDRASIAVCVSPPPVAPPPAGPESRDPVTLAVSFVEEVPEPLPVE